MPFEKFKRYTNGVYHDECGMSRVGGQRRKEGERWNEDSLLFSVVTEKRREFVMWMQGTEMSGTENGCETDRKSCKKNGELAMGQAHRECFRG